MEVGKLEVAAPPSPTVRVRLPGTSRLPGWGLRLEAEAVAEAERRGDTVAYLDAQRTGTELLVRCRQPGDRIWPVGMQGRQKLKQVFIDAKVPRARRNRIPVLTTPDGDVVWVPGLRIDRRFAADESSTLIWRVTVTEEEEAPCSSP